jgi:hypothetical protein
MSPLRRLFVFAFWGATLFAYGAAIVPGYDAPHLGGSDKLDHMAAFFTITFLGRAAYPRLPVFLLFLAMAGFGAFIEASQAMPFIGRDAEWTDWLADVAASFVGLVVAQPFAILADRRRARRRLPAASRAQSRQQ